MPARWLLLYNCQAQGLANCLNLMCDEVEVEQFDPPAYARERARVLDRLDGYERILAAPHFFSGNDNDDLVAVRDRVVLVPTLFFSGYHPDTCYVDAGGRPLRGPMGEYHSLIVYAAFLAGLPEAAALAQFREPTFQRLGYTAQWARAWRRLEVSFSRHGFDISPLRPAWSRRGPFMYTVNHPRIACLRDVARLVLAREGRNARYLDALPPDNLANGPVFPVYPGLASRLGCEGSVLFKRPGEFRHVTLEAFIGDSYAAYRASGEHRIRGDYADALGLVAAGLREAA